MDGYYEVAVWQEGCAAGCDGEAAVEWAERYSRGIRFDLCARDIWITPGREIDLLATWAPGEGCSSLAPPK